MRNRLGTEKNSLAHLRQIVFYFSGTGQTEQRRATARELFFAIAFRQLLGD